MTIMLTIWKIRLLIDWTDEIKKLIKTMMMKEMMMINMIMMKIMIALMNVHNSFIHRRDIEIFKFTFDLLRFENNEIREMMIV